jgi:2-iminoacetate synthase
MDLLRSGEEGKFCKLNAILTFREWLDDFASTKTKQVSQKVIEQEIEQVRERMPNIFQKFTTAYNKIKAGQRDIYF